MDNQDWTSVKWTKKPITNAKEAKSNGLPVKANQKMGAINKGNFSGSQDGQKLAKVARTEIGTYNKVTKETANAIIKGRSQKKMSQKELAQAINEKPEVVASYESKRAMPNIQIINKMERVLGVHLVGKNIGAIKEKKFAKKK